MDGEFKAPGKEIAVALDRLGRHGTLLPGLLEKEVVDIEGQVGVPGDILGSPQADRPKRRPHFGDAGPGAGLMNLILKGISPEADIGGVGNLCLCDFRPDSTAGSASASLPPAARSDRSRA